MKVSVDLQRCKGYAACMIIAPSIFDVSEETNKVILLNADPGEEARAMVEEAIRGCPVKAISWVANDGR
jgi:2'-carboxy-2,3-dihydroxybiphenyl 1,2-dioxygenase small subunit/ferredoxin